MLTSLIHNVELWLDISQSNSPNGIFQLQAICAQKMASLTISDLKNELINHGVELPPSSAKKEEYVTLYEKNISGEKVPFLTMRMLLQPPPRGDKFRAC